MAFLAPVVRYPEALESSAIPHAVVSRLPPFLQAFPTPVLAAFPAVILLLLVALALPTRKAHPIAIAADGTVRTRTPRSEAPTVLLAGPCGAGKTALFSHLAWGTVPATHTSQREAEAVACIQVDASKERWTEEDGEKLPEQFADAPPRTSATQTIRLVDLPGHSRLRARAAEYIPASHAVVFCVDATLASRASGAGAARAKDGNGLSDAVDQLHSLLMSIARHRLSRSSRSKKLPEPPALLILFTRADLSPLLPSSGLDASQRSKRSAQLLDKARAGLEAEMARRRAGMGLNAHHGRSAKIGGLSKVGGEGAQRGFLASFLALVGIESRSSKAAVADDDEDEEDEDSIDYLDWEAAQRAQAAAAARSASAGGGVGALNAAPFSFDRLDEEVVWDGKAKWAIASVGKATGWAATEGDGGNTDTLELRKWLGAL